MQEIMHVSQARLSGVTLQSSPGLKPSLLTQAELGKKYQIWYKP